jgi:hypothetical protein
MPDADTVWLTPLNEMHALLEGAGLTVRWQEDWSEPHRATAEALTAAYARVDDKLMAAHRLWAEWLATGRVRKFAIVAERQIR